MEKLFNGKKLNQQLKEKKLSTIIISQDLQVNGGRINELLNGIPNDKLLIKICNKYNLVMDDFYNGFIEPERMKTLRKNIKLAKSNGFNLETIAMHCNVGEQLIRNILNYNTFICHININTENKINNGINKLINKNEFINEININTGKINLRKSIGNIAYEKLLNDANNNFNGNIKETLKFIINTHYYK